MTPTRLSFSSRAVQSNGSKEACRSRSVITRRAVAVSEKIEDYREIVDGAGQLAQVYEQQQELPEANAAIDQAITANTKIPDELYLVPRNLAIKAEIVNKMGQAKNRPRDCTGRASLS